MSENDNDTGVTVELYHGNARDPAATCDLDYPWIARQSTRALTERIATELAGDLQKGGYRLFLLESGTEPISRQWKPMVDADDKLRFRELRRNVDEIVRDWRVTARSELRVE